MNRERKYTLEQAIRMIALGSTPCSTCNRVHDNRRVPAFKWSSTPGLEPIWTWTTDDPKDGHAYYYMTPSTFAQKVLEEMSSSDHRA